MDAQVTWDLARIFVKPSNQMLDISTILDRGRNDSDGIPVCGVSMEILVVLYSNRLITQFSFESLY
jgi:hypothetical protein